MATHYNVKEGKVLEKLGLLDGRASVQLMEVFPTLCPVGYTPEYLIVQAARTSFGKGLTTPEDDAKLIRYLVKNKHTSPLEMCSVTLRISCPIPIATHFLRHRTGKFNAFSQRYSTLPPGEGEDTSFYLPDETPEGIRGQCPVNKQGSVANGLTPEQTDRVRDLMWRGNEQIENLHVTYRELVKAGCAKEVARFYTATSVYTTLVMQMDISNLQKMLSLRADPHAQWETQQIATAILELVRPFFPTVFQVYEEDKAGMFLSAPEVEALRTGMSLATTSVSERKAFEEKKRRLHPPSSPNGIYLTEPAAAAYQAHLATTEEGLTQTVSSTATTPQVGVASMKE